MNTYTCCINIERLMSRIRALGAHGALAGGGVRRLTLTDEDQAGRAAFVQWMEELELDIKIDQIGNIFGTRLGNDQDAAPVMIGSHLDTVSTGGLYDGSLGVLAGLEVIETLNDLNINTHRPITIASFTNEEGVRFVPDMMGSLIFSGGVALEEVLAGEAIDGSGATLGKELQRIGYAGDLPCGYIKPHSFLELHIEQGPVLEAEEIQVAAVEGVQGIYWTEYILHGTANHAGTTPIRLRHDAGYAASAIANFVRTLADDIGKGQVGTVGVLELYPNLINVIAERARLTVDLRNNDEDLLKTAQANLDQFVKEISASAGLTYDRREMVRLPPVIFDIDLVSSIEIAAKELNYTVKRMPSGAGHDAQMLASVCPTAMIFIPSIGGISHSIKEYSKPEDIEAGGNVLLKVTLQLSTK